MEFILYKIVIQPMFVNMNKIIYLHLDVCIRLLIYFSSFSEAVLNLWFYVLQYSFHYTIIASKIEIQHTSVSCFL